MTCIFCRSKTHNYRSCPVAYMSARKQELNRSFKQDYFGQAPNVFVGRHGYPNVRVGILGTERYDLHDDPAAWSARSLPIEQIMRLRSELVNSYFPAKIKGSAAKLTALTRDVSLAKRPVDVEVNLKERPRFRVTFSRDLSPHGPNVGLRNAMITENVKVDTRVDKAVSADDLRAADAVRDLSGKGVSPYYLQRAFSMGNFGLKTERKLVPTRWSITAVDDIQGKAKIAELKKHKFSDCTAYFGGHLGNYYLLLFFDDAWQYELFEQHLSSKQRWTDYEPHAGRKTYASDTAGGYYAARLPIAEHLARKRAQASVLAIRIITDEYTAPLGVWVVREAVRKTLAAQPLRFADRKLMLDYAKEFLKKKFSYDAGPLIAQSLLTKSLFGQRKLGDF